MGNKEKPNKPHEIIEKNLFDTIEWQANITVIDLSNREISNFDENVILPQNLIVFNLSNNELVEVPRTVLNLDQLKTLDLSYNKIVSFDETPNFCHTLESLIISNNQLEGPPYWVWAEKPRNLAKLNISNNIQLCDSFDKYYFEELLKHTTLVSIIDLYNCRLNEWKKILSTFKHAKEIYLGHMGLNLKSVNHLENVPCVGLEECCDIEVLNMCNTHIYNIQPNIDIYQNLKNIDLSDNNINGLPNEFCNLKNLEVCILSCNGILYLPDDMFKLTKLIKLHLDNNKLCMIPDTLKQLRSLKTLDLYNNHLYEGIDDVSNLEEYDFAQNYNDEPNSDDYLEKKRKIRHYASDRMDGRAPEIENEDIATNEDEFYEEDSNTESEAQQHINTRCSTPEDWDSDDFWMPSQADFYPSRILNYKRGISSTPNLQWLNFVKEKMAEGNFCPMDMHSISISEKVMYEKMHNPQPVYESDGQFDDFSDDDT